MIVDSHCHLDQLDLSPYDGNLDKALAAAKKNDVGYFLCVCIDMENFPQVLSIAEQYENVSASVGVHPNVEESLDATEDELLQFAAHPKIVAIGETGLDYYRTSAETEWQRERFRTHIRVAKQTQKPLIIHTRQAKEDTLKVMREEGAEVAGGVMHCFTESWEMAQHCLELGFYISFSGIVTFKNATELQEVAQKIPLDRMLIETDSPYLAPVPYRGKPNEPAYVRYVAECVAKLRGESYDAIAKATTDNFFNLFKLDKGNKE